MPREFNRSERVASQLQRELSELIAREIKDPRLGFVTVSDVQVTRDLAQAKVFITVLGEQADKKQSLVTLKRAAAFLRHKIGRRLYMRTVPELLFVYDDSIEQGLHMERLLAELHPEDNDHQDPT